MVDIPVQVEVVKRDPPPDRLDANIVRLEHELRKQLSIVQVAGVGQLARGAAQITINAPLNSVNISGISPEFLAYVLKMAYGLWREDFERGLESAGGLTLNLKALERRTIIAALEQVGWRQDRAAPLLGITRRSVGYLVTQHGITHPRWRRNKPQELMEAT